ncbi:MAG: hypothetical protein J6Q48_01230 [Bacteroidaceae bacterium]|nr:hypothetical protein [Bacteroidaceae bacterium]
MKYKIKTISETGSTLYFNTDFSFFGEKFATEYRGKKAALDGLEYAKKCASSQVILDNLQIIEA